MSEGSAQGKSQASAARSARQGLATPPALVPGQALHQLWPAERASAAIYGHDGLIDRRAARRMPGLMPDYHAAATAVCRNAMLVGPGRSSARRRGSLELQSSHSISTSWWWRRRTRPSFLRHQDASTQRYARRRRARAVRHKNSLALVYRRC